MAPNLPRSRSFSARSSHLCRIPLNGERVKGTLAPLGGSAALDTLSVQWYVGGGDELTEKLLTAGWS